MAWAMRVNSAVMLAFAEELLRAIEELPRVPVVLAAGSVARVWSLEKRGFLLVFEAHVWDFFFFLYEYVVCGYCCLFR